MSKEYETQSNEEQFDEEQFNEELWKEVMSDFFPNASTEEEIEEELMNWIISGMIE